MFKRFAAHLAAVCLCVAAATPALAAPTERDRLGASLAHEIMAAVPVNQLFDGAVEPMGKMFNEFSRPEWTEMFKQAAHEELAAKMPVIEAAFARSFFADFTVDELKAGSALFEGPAGADMRRAISAEAVGKPAPSPSPATQRELQKAMRDPNTRSFLDRLSKMDTNSGGEAFGKAIAPLVLPGMFRRFGEKAEASERAHQAAVSP